MKNLSGLALIPILVIIALLSYFPLAAHFSAEETHSETVASIDDKTDTVLELAAASAGLSAGLSLLPGDAGTPIAEKLADFSEYFLLILCVLYAEKYLLGITATAAFKLLIPLGCVVGIVGALGSSAAWRRLGLKLALFGLVFYITIPVSISLSDAIYEQHRSQIESTVSEARELNSDLEDETAGGASDNTKTSDANGLAGIVSGIKSVANNIQNLAGNATESLANLKDNAVHFLNAQMEALAVLIVTSCVIPVFAFIFFIWLVKTLLNLDFSPFAEKAARKLMKP